MLSILLTAFFLVAPDPATEAMRLLNEVIAGSEVNQALITKGYAEYEVRRTPGEGFKPPAELQGQRVRPALPLNFKVMMHFDGNRVRWDFEDWRCVRDGTRDIMFHGPDLGTPKEQSAKDYTAWIYEMNKSMWSPYPYHPRWIGISAQPDTVEHTETTIADVIRAARKSAKASVQAVRDGNLIKVTFEYTKDFVKREFWIDPNQAYGIVRYLNWGLKHPDKPVTDMTVEFRAIGDTGAFIANKRIVISRGFQDGKSVELGTMETRLLRARIGTA